MPSPKADRRLNAEPYFPVDPPPWRRRRSGAIAELSSSWTDSDRPTATESFRLDREGRRPPNAAEGDEPYLGSCAGQPSAEEFVSARPEPGRWLYSAKGVPRGQFVLYWPPDEVPFALWYPIGSQNIPSRAANELVHQKSVITTGSHNNLAKHTEIETVAFYAETKGRSPVATKEETGIAVHSIGQ